MSDKYEMDQDEIDWLNAPMGPVGTNWHNQRVTELEAQVARLQGAYHDALFEIDWWPASWQTMTEDERWAEHRANGLNPGDLDPVGGEK